MWGGRFLFFLVRILGNNPEIVAVQIGSRYFHHDDSSRWRGTIVIVIRVIIIIVILIVCDSLLL